MKAAVVFNKGENPKYVEDFEEPGIPNEGELLISVKAAAVKNLDKMRASGTHYSVSSEGWTPKVVGGDGVGTLEDGTLVYAIGLSGMIAEKAVVAKDQAVQVPEGLDIATAAALPNAVMGSALALRFRAGIKKGETVLINGATGVTGKVAVQLAKHYGAKKVIATGRNEQVLKELLALGADEVIRVNLPDDDFINRLKQINLQDPVDIVLDYLWGHTAELILDALKGKGGYSHRTRYITIGGMAGDSITLSSSILRSTDIQISGSGFGSWTREEMKQFISDILPEMFGLAATGKLKIETVSFHIKEIETVWNREVESGKRLVILI